MTPHWGTPEFKALFCILNSKEGGSTCKGKGGGGCGEVSEKKLVRLEQFRAAHIRANNGNTVRNKKRKTLNQNITKAARKMQDKFILELRKNK